MSLILVERLGGLAGFGGPNARLRSRGQIALPDLSEAQRETLEQLFQLKEKSTVSEMRDGFRYRISRPTRSDNESIELPEATVPAWITACVKDELII